MPGVLLSVSFTVFTVFITAFQGMYDHPQSSGKKTEGLVNIGLPSCTRLVYLSQT